MPKAPNTPSFRGLSTSDGAPYPPPMQAVYHNPESGFCEIYDSAVFDAPTMHSAPVFADSPCVPDWSPYEISSAEMVALGLRDDMKMSDATSLEDADSSPAYTLRCSIDAPSQDRLFQMLHETYTGTTYVFTPGEPPKTSQDCWNMVARVLERESLARHKRSREYTGPSETRSRSQPPPRRQRTSKGRPSDDATLYQSSTAGNLASGGYHKSTYYGPRHRYDLANHFKTLGLSETGRSASAQGRTQQVYVKDRENPPPVAKTFLPRPPGTHISKSSGSASGSSSTHLGVDNLKAATVSSVSGKADNKDVAAYDKDTTDNDKGTANSDKDVTVHTKVTTIDKVPTEGKSLEPAREIATVAKVCHPGDGSPSASGGGPPPGRPGRVRVPLKDLPRKGLGMSLPTWYLNQRGY